MEIHEVVVGAILTAYIPLSLAWAFKVQAQINKCMIENTRLEGEIKVGKSKHLSITDNFDEIKGQLSDIHEFIVEARDFMAKEKSRKELHQ